MAARALAAAAAVGGGRRGLVTAPLLASARYCSGASAQAEEVTAALNSKNVEVLQDERAGTENSSTLAAGVLLEEKEDASTWVPDQETGVFGPADADSSTHVAPPSSSTLTGGSSSSVLDQTVFVREDDMEDVERPPMANADAGSNSY